MGFLLPPVLSILGAACLAAGVEAPLEPDAGSPVHVGRPCLVPGVPDRHDPITIGVVAPIDPRHAPQPRNDAERLVFRQLYETLVRVDEEGCLQPELAAEWLSLDGRTWVFHIRPDARFWDGSFVWAGDVRDAWLSERARNPAAGAKQPWAMIESVPRQDDVKTTTLTVVLREPSENLPDIFAHPGLAVSKVDPASRWALGSGPYRIGREDPMAQGVRLQLVPAETYRMGMDGELAAGGRARGECLVLVHPNADPRDLANAGADLLLVRERGLLSYFASLPDYRQVALPWNRVYVLVSPRLCPEIFSRSSRDPLAQPEETIPAITASLRNELAHSVTLSDARGLESGDFPGASSHAERTLAADSSVVEDSCRTKGPLWAEYPTSMIAGARATSRSSLPTWDGIRLVAGASVPTGSEPHQPPRILFIEGDLDAGRLAGRLAVLMTWDRSQIAATYGAPAAALLTALLPRAGFHPPITPGLSSELFWESFARADEMAYVVSQECTSRRELLHPCGQPLVLTRAHLVYRRGLVGIEADRDGTLLLARAGWRAEGGLE